VGFGQCRSGMEEAQRSGVRRCAPSATHEVQGGRRRRNLLEHARKGKSPRISVCLAYPLTCDNQTKRDRIACMNTTERATPLFSNSPMCLLLEPRPNLAASLAPTWPDEDVDDTRSSVTFTPDRQYPRQQAPEANGHGHQYLS
jgi:hypothetical protein